MKKSELKKWAREHFMGIENCTMPSFTPDMQHLDEEAIRHDVRMAIRHGFSSTLCTCEAGLTFEEAKQFVKIVAEEAQGKIHVATTLLFDTLEQNWEMLEWAEKVGCTHVLFGYPAGRYWKSPEEIYKVSKDMMDSSNLGFVLYPSPHYNFERFHNSGFPLDVLFKLAEHPNAIAAKVGELGLLAECMRHIGDQVLLSCPIERFAPFCYLAFKQQWIGAGPYEYLQSPDKPYFVQYFNLLLEDKFEQAMEIYWHLAPARNIFEASHFQVAMLGTYPWTTYKFIQWCVGGNGGFTRQPNMKPHQHEMEQIRMAFHFIGIEPAMNDEEFYVGRVRYAKMKQQNAASHGPAS
jgi:4-hydroxy-tetrahydrodipicolinate synthase